MEIMEVTFKVNGIEFRALADEDMSKHDVLKMVARDYHKYIKITDVVCTNKHVERLGKIK